jgi:hypothetical protein
VRPETGTPRPLSTAMHCIHTSHGASLWYIYWVSKLLLSVRIRLYPVI